MTVAEVYCLRIIGAVGGMILAMAFVIPTTRREFAQRCVFSVGTGVMLGPVLRVYMEWPREPEHVIAAAGLIALGSWWIFEAFVTALRAGWIPWVKLDKKP